MALTQTAEKKIFILLSAIVGVYILARAYYFPVMTDEVATFFMYVQHGRILPPDIAWNGNNHILNSLLMRLSYLLFGPSVFALRLPELLFVPAYFLFVYKTGTLVKNKVARLTFYISMLGTHFIIEYFALARGYGMSLTLLTGAIWYLVKAVQNYRLADVSKTLILTLLAVSANLNLIITLLIVFSLLVFYFVLNFKQLSVSEKSGYIFVFLTGLAGIGFFIYFSFGLLEKGSLFGGTDTGFISGLVNGLSIIVFGKAAFVFTGFFVLIVVLSFGFYSYLIIKKRIAIRQLPPGGLFLIIMTGNITAAVAMHYLLDVMYQDGRMAIYYLPLLYGLAAFTAGDMTKSFGKNFTFLLAPLWALPFISVGQVSLESCSHDSTPYMPYAFFEDINGESEPNSYPPVVAGIHKRKLVWSYYNYLSGGKMNPLLFSDEPVPYADYLMYDFEKHKKPADLYYEIDHNESSGLSLLKRNKPAPKQLLTTNAIKNTPVSTDKEYFKILKISLDTVNAGAVSVEFDFQIQSKAVPFEGAFICELRNKDKSIMSYEAINLDEMHPVWNETRNRVRNVLLLPVSGKPSTLLVYFWNKRKVKYVIMKGETKVYEFQPQKNP